MLKKAIIISAILITIIIIVSIIMSVVNMKPVTFASVVSYDNDTPVMVEAPASKTASDNDVLFIESLLEHENSITLVSIIVITVFTILFYGAKRSRS